MFAIAAAALQMAYDKTRPAWMQTDNAGTEEERLFSKPILIKRSQTSVSQQQLD